MSKPKFTAGPWVVAASPQLHTFGETTLKGERIGRSFELCDFTICSHVSGHSLPIAVVKRECGFSDVEGKVHQYALPIEANVALIAAAPEMFEALEKLWTCVANGVDSDPEKWKEATKLTQDALAKARGES